MTSGAAHGPSAEWGKVRGSCNSYPPNRVLLVCDENGDERGNPGDVFAEFVRQHNRSLFSTAFLLTGSRERAEDLLQETLTALYPQWHRVEAADQPLPYVRRALTNRFLTTGGRPAAR